ncbi:aminopeptidase PepB [Pectobacterium aroidearum]|uniref:aminopeptidase PepB n=1 Tax=Pectobacterium aroidearum TaxID=1201031 RepID=UPI0015DF5E3F|nr:aminopeptidase PepB [Pectobacterium aroidearum]MBA0206887.1 aminopeptidase PepB [Pectobacterium aroidearum]
MTNNTMLISLSTQPADARWGEKATLSVNEQGFTIHVGTASLNGKAALATIQRAARKIDGQGIKHVKLAGEGWDLANSWAFWQGYRGPKGQRTVEWAELNDADKKELNDRLKIVDWVRDTINLPAEDLGPEQLATRAVDLLCDVACDAISYRITKGEDLREQNYAGLHTVGRGSERQPVLLALDYNPTGNADAPVFACLVGKGITFDTGGYSLKPSSSMDSMKSDMGGAATLTGALALAASRGLQQRVKLYLCCADNMVSGNAFRLGDIIRYRNGKTVEVMNTDAEGRLVLADGLIDASEQNPQWIIDCATLTGAAKMALGNDYHALFSFDDELVAALQESAKEENEPFWRLPLEEFHRSHLPSSFADLNNIASGANTAGASTAAAFLSHFVKNYQQGWLHIDCSATYRKGAVEQWATGATGLGVRTLANLLLSNAK